MEPPTLPKGFSGAYRSAGTRAVVAMALLGLGALVDLAALSHNYSGFALLEPPQPGA